MPPTVRNPMSAEELAILLEPYITKRRAVEYGEGSGFKLNVTLLQKQAGMMKAMHDAQPNLSYKKTVLKGALREVGIRRKLVKADDLEKWVEVNERRLHLMCRHLSQALVRTPRPRWLCLILQQPCEEDSQQTREVQAASSQAASSQAAKSGQGIDGNRDTGITDAENDECDDEEAEEEANSGQGIDGNRDTGTADADNDECDGEEAEEEEEQEQEQKETGENEDAADGEDMDEDADEEDEANKRKLAWCDEQQQAFRMKDYGRREYCVFMEKPTYSTDPMVAVFQDGSRFELTTLLRSDYEAKMAAQAVQKKRRDHGAYYWEAEHSVSKHRLCVKQRPDRQPLMSLFEQGRYIALSRKCDSQSASACLSGCAVSQSPVGCCRPILRLNGGEFLGICRQSGLRFLARFSLDFRPKSTPGTPLDRRDPPRTSICTKNQPRRPILRPNGGECFLGICRQSGWRFSARFSLDFRPKSTPTSICTKNQHRRPILRPNGGEFFLGICRQYGWRFSARFSLDFRPKSTPGTPLDRRGPPRTSICTENQPFLVCRVSGPIPVQADFAVYREEVRKGRRCT